jgi:hypothetical protein
VFSSQANESAHTHEKINPTMLWHNEVLAIKRWWNIIFPTVYQRLICAWLPLSPVHFADGYALVGNYAQTRSPTEAGQGKVALPAGAAQTVPAFAPLPDVSLLPCLFLSAVCRSPRPRPRLPVRVASHTA